MWIKEAGIKGITANTILTFIIFFLLTVAWAFFYDLHVGYCGRIKEWVGELIVFLVIVIPFVGWMSLNVENFLSGAVLIGAAHWCVKISKRLK